jgi:hypothetical protein
MMLHLGIVVLNCSSVVSGPATLLGNLFIFLCRFQRIGLFCVHLWQLGVNVLGLADEPYDSCTGSKAAAEYSTS